MECHLPAAGEMDKNDLMPFDLNVRHVEGKEFIICSIAVLFS